MGETGAVTAAMSRLLQAILRHRKQGPIQFLENNPTQSSFWVRFHVPQDKEKLASPSNCKIPSGVQLPPAAALRRSHTRGRRPPPLMSCTRIRHSIGTENLVPEQVNYTKIAIRVTVMNKVQFLLASEPRKPLKPRSLYVIFLVEKDMRVKRRRACDCRDHKKI
jgi:hypothetical protein